tara:strand:+ start:205 stop:465 length:261 start_codon:yes stop_codon:yes gene_type:complete
VKKRDKTMKKIKINYNDFICNRAYKYRVVENSNLDELVKEVRYGDDTSEWVLENVGSDVASLDEVFTPPAGFTESSSFDPEDDYNF